MLGMSASRSPETLEDLRKELGASLVPLREVTQHIQAQTTRTKHPVCSSCMDCSLKKQRGHLPPPLLFARALVRVRLHGEIGEHVEAVGIGEVTLVAGDGVQTHGLDVAIAPQDVALAVVAGDQIAQLLVAVPGGDRRGGVAELAALLAQGDLTP